MNGQQKNGCLNEMTIVFYAVESLDFRLKALKDPLLYE